jgi:hypothetical protein
VSDPNYVGPTWHFNALVTDTAPEMTMVPEGVITWVDALPQEITVTVEDNGEGDIEMTGIEWSFLQGPASLENIAGVDPNLFVTITSADPLAPTSSFDLSSVNDDPNAFGFYKYELTVTDTENALEDNAPLTDTNELWITVRADKCTAAKDLNNYYSELKSDFDVTGPSGTPDCLVDLLDFAEMAADWLDDSSLDVPNTYTHE